MQSSKYAQQVPVILAEMEEGRKEDDIHQADQLPEKVVYLYPLEGGGIVMTNIPLEDESGIVESREPETDQRPMTRHDPPYFLHFLLVLLLFVCLDNIDTVFAQLAPIVNVTITPLVKTISTTATVNVGDHADIHGRVLPALTLSQSQTVTATGHGHQDATRAAGSITFFNGSFSSKTIDAGTVFTGSSGIQVVTDQTVLIPPGNPPTYGEATVSAVAVHAGNQGNIEAGDINTSVSSDVLAKNDAFSGGRNARDFTIVSKADIQGVVSQLIPHLVQSQQAALTAQLTTGESLLSPACTPKTITNHASGEEAQTVSVTVTETCAALAYNAQELQTTGIRILTTTRAASLLHFQRVGDMHTSILSQTINGQRASLRVQLVSTWVYALNERELTQEIIGKPRLDAIHLLRETPGVQSVTIAGVSDNQQLPTDPAHVHLSLFALLP